MHSWTTTHFIGKLNCNRTFLRNGAQQCDTRMTQQLTDSLLKLTAEQLHLADLIHDNYRQLARAFLHNHQQNNPTPVSK